MIILIHTHRCTGTNTHIHTHAHTWTHTCTYTCVHTHRCTCTCTHTHIYMHIHTCAWAHTHKHTQVYVLIHAHTRRTDKAGHATQLQMVVNFVKVITEPNWSGFLGLVFEGLLLLFSSNQISYTFWSQPIIPFLFLFLPLQISPSFTPPLLRRESEP